MVGALCKPYLAGGQRHCAAASRAAAGQRRVPWVARATEHFIERATAGTELRCVGFGDNDPALALDPFDHRMRLRRNMIAEDWRPISGAHTCDIGQIFNCDRQAAKPAGLVLGFPAASVHQLPGMVAGSIET